jgi:hypothetical protein
MKIYFACSITGGRNDETIYQKIVATLLGDGHAIPTAGLAGPDVMQYEGILNPVEVYDRDTGWIQTCEVLIAEVSTPSHGVGYEIGYALQLSKPVFAIYKDGVIVSKMILGNRDPNLQTFAYQNIEDAIEFICGHLGRVTPEN